MSSGNAVLILSNLQCISYFTQVGNNKPIANKPLVCRFYLEVLLAPIRFMMFGRRLRVGLPLTCLSHYPSNRYRQVVHADTVLFDCARLLILCVIRYCNALSDNNLSLPFNSLQPRMRIPDTELE